MQKNTTKIGNIRSYLLTTLYNSHTTQDHYYRAEVNYDFYGQKPNSYIFMSQKMSQINRGKKDI